MTTIYNRIQNNFTQVSNQALLHPALSSKAYKLYAYMCYRIGTHPAWEFNKKEILKNFTEGEKAMRSAFNELIDAGFLIRKQSRAQRGKFGQVDYEIFAEPVNTDSAPQVQNRRADKRRAENASLNNKEVINKDNISSSEEKKKKLTSEEIKDKIKDHFKDKGLKSDAEEFLLYYDKNLHKIFNKLSYWADKWEKKFIEDVQPKRNLSESSSPAHHVSEDKLEAYDRMRIIMEYCKKNCLNPDSLSKDEKEKIINGK